MSVCHLLCLNTKQKSNLAPEGTVTIPLTLLWLLTEAFSRHHLFNRICCRPLSSCDFNWVDYIWKEIDSTVGNVIKKVMKHEGQNCETCRNHSFVWYQSWFVWFTLWQKDTTLPTILNLNSDIPDWWRSLLPCKCQKLVERWLRSGTTVQYW